VRAAAASGAQNVFVMRAGFTYSRVVLCGVTFVIAAAPAFHARCASAAARLVGASIARVRLPRLGSLRPTPILATLAE
jgi:hypothetical protein